MTRMFGEILGCAWPAIAEPRSYFERLRGAARDRGGWSLSPAIAAATAPILACAFLALSLGRGQPRGEIVILVASIPAGALSASLAFFAVGSILGSKVRFGLVFAAWGQSYWATDLFLAGLALSHLGASAFGIQPSALPGWAVFALLSLSIGAAFWKFLYALSVVRFALGLRGWRFCVALALLAALAAAYAFASAVVLGTKVPLL